MQYFKVRKYNMWHVHALDDGVEAIKYLPEGAIPITEEEADEIRAAPPSNEYLDFMEESRAALGGRNMAIYPTKDIKEAIGAICVNSSQLELTMRLVIWQAAGVVPEIGMALTGGKLSIAELTEMLNTLLKLRHPNLAGNAQATISRIRQANDKRGKFVHGIWSPGENGKILVGKALLARNEDKGKFNETTLDELHDLAEEYLILSSEILTKLSRPLIQ